MRHIILRAGLALAALALLAVDRVAADYNHGNRPGVGSYGAIPPVHNLNFNGGTYFQPSGTYLVFPPASAQGANVPPVIYASPTPWNGTFTNNAFPPAGQLRSSSSYTPSYEGNYSPFIAPSSSSLNYSSYPSSNYYAPESSYRGNPYAPSGGGTTGTPETVYLYAR
jgi:hypothetical protein